MHAGSGGGPLPLPAAGVAWAQPDPFEVPLEQLKKKAPENVVRFVTGTVGDLASAAPTVTLRLVTRDGFKIYDKGLEFTYRDAARTVEKLVFQPNPPPKRVMDPFYNEERDVHMTGGAFTVSLPPGALADGAVTVRFEACSVSMCLLPTYFDVPLLEGARGKPRKKDDLGYSPVADAASQQSRVGPADDPFAAIGGEGAKFDAPSAAVTSAPSVAVTSAPAVAVTSAPAFEIPRPAAREASVSVQGVTDRASLWVQSSLSARSWLLFPALFLAGLLMNLTPCVYPMIPITLNVLSQFGAHGISTDEERLRRRRLLPFVYVAGMVLAYSAMGVVAAMTGTIFGSLLQNPVVTGVLAVVMVALGLSMLGVFNMTALQSFATRIPVAEKYPVAGVLTMGAVSGLVSAPCTGPVLSTILLLIGQSRDPLYGFILMLFFSLGFGAPYVGLGLFTQKLGRLPKAGGLLGGVKFVFAALMFALAIYYLKPLFGGFDEVRWMFVRPSIAAVAAVLLFGVVCFLYGRLQPSAEKVARVGTLASLTALALWLTLMVTSGFVAPSAVASSGDGASEARDGVRWVKDWQQALVRADVEKKPMMVDAWAEWCAACLKMDETTWKDPEVVRTLNERFIPVKLDFTRSSPFSEDIIKLWDLSGLPAVAFFPVGADPKAAPPILFREAVTAQAFLETAAKVLPGQSDNGTPR